MEYAFISFHPGRGKFGETPSPTVHKLYYKARENLEPPTNLPLQTSPYNPTNPPTYTQ